MTDYRQFRADLIAKGIVRSPVSLRDILRRLRMVERELDPLTLETITLDQASEYVTDGRLRGWTTAQYNNRARALNSWLKWHHKLREAPITLLPEEYEEYRALTDEQHAKLHRAIPKMEPLHAATCAMAIGVGIRPEEVCRLDVEDYDPNAHTIFIRQPAKRGRKRRIPIPEWVCDELDRWRTTRPTTVPGGDYRALFLIRHRSLTKRAHPGSLGRILRDEGRRQGMRVNFQIARHTVATRLLRERVDIRFIQYYLGHVNIRNTARYAEVRFEDVEKEYRRTTFSGNLLSPAVGDENTPVQIQPEDS